MITAGALRPRFRGRLMIPIRDHQGRVVAFTARQTALTPEDDPAREAKYVNSPETPIFTKGNLLFNLDRARTAVGEDSPSSWSRASSTRSGAGRWASRPPSPRRARRSPRASSRSCAATTSQVECFFDSDAAGQKAALRMLPMALKAGSRCAS
jgi:DNA primase